MHTLPHKWQVLEVIHGQKLRSNTLCVRVGIESHNIAFECLYAQYDDSCKQQESKFEVSLQEWEIENSLVGQ